MATLTLYPKSLDSDHSYYSISGATSVGDSANSQYATVGLTRGSKATTYASWSFDMSELPVNVVINSVKCTAKCYINATNSRYVTTRQIQLYSGSNSKGSATTVGNSTSQLSLTTGEWTYEELLQAKIRLYAVRNTNNTDTNYYFRFYGATLTIDYTEAEVEVTPTEIEGSKEFNYTGGVQKIKLPEGKYKLECWGAQGGDYQSYEGGKGGYSVGTILLKEPTTLYIYVGGHPDTVTTSRAVVPGGYNGGGNGQNRYYSNTYTYGQGGGGASDIRIESNSLYARVIVAGGGGGAASENNTNKQGGGLQGGSGGAAETESYVAGQTAPTSNNYFLAGTFGEGASAHTSRNNYMHGSGGGGGGWYGGYAYNYAQDNTEALKGYNGGGSGYVYNKDTAVNYPSGCLLNSEYYLTDSKTESGEGRTGHGLVIITNITKNDPILFIRQNSEWKEVNTLWKKDNNQWAKVNPQDVFNELTNNSPSGYFINK